VQDASIKAYFGGDTTQLQAAINSAHAMTGKFAKDSAKVFEDVSRAEADLAAFRKTADLQRGASFQKEIILQREIIGLKKSIDAIQGQTAEKIALQIQLEQKLLQLEMNISAAATKTAQARAAAGGALYSSTMSDAAKAAQAAATNTGLFGASLGRLNIVGKAVTGTLKSLTGIGASLFAPQIAEQIARWITGFSKGAEKELEKVLESSERAAEKAEQRLEKARAEAARKDEEYGKMMTDQQNLVWEARLEHFENEAKARKEAAEDAIRKSKEAANEDLKWYQKRTELEKKLRDQKLESLKPEERVLALTKEVTDLKKQQSKYTKDDNEYLALQVQINDANKSIEEERLAIAAATAKEEKKITEEKKSQLGAIAGIMGGSRFNEASDETLAEVARRNRTEAQRIKADPFNQGIGQSLEAARLEAEAMNAERELSFRRKIRQDFSIGGEDMARRNFQGDPLQFDRVFAQLVKGQTIDEKQLDVWQKIEQLARRGIPVVLQGENT
jgi:hypothetical protein